MLNLTDTVEIMSIIDSLGSESSGPYSIPTEILKLLKPNLCHPLTAIFNMSFVTGVYPDQLKTAKVIPVFKKGDKLLVSNYRPISLLSNLNKIYEKIVYKRLYSFSNIQKKAYLCVGNTCSKKKVVRNLGGNLWTFFACSVGLWFQIFGFILSRYTNFDVSN